MRKHGPKLLGVALAVTLLMAALATASARAENLTLGDHIWAGEVGLWVANVGGLAVEFPAGGAPEEIGGGTSAVRLLVPAKSVEIICGEGRITEGYVENEYENWNTLVQEPGGHAHSKILFLECKVFQINPTTGALISELKKCTEELRSAGGFLPTSHHVTAEVLTLVKRHNGNTYLLFHPLISQHAEAVSAEKLELPYTTLEFGGTCALPELVKVRGSIAAPAPPALAEEPTISIDTFGAAGKALQTLLGAKLSFGASEAFFVGEGKLELIGPGEELEWGAL